MAHKHAENMASYALDSAETNTPWLLWELSDNGMDWYPCSTHPAWNEQTWYRHKKTVIKIGRFEFPKPMTRAPKEGTDYFYLDFGDNGFVVGGSSWAGDDFDMKNVAMNVSHLSHKDAQTHADVLNAICRGNV